MKRGQYWNCRFKHKIERSPWYSGSLRMSELRVGKIYGQFSGGPLDGIPSNPIESHAHAPEESSASSTNQAWDGWKLLKILVPKNGMVGICWGFSTKAPTWRTSQASWKKKHRFVWKKNSTPFNLMVESQHHHTPHHSIWANYNNSHTWNKAILGWFPLLTMIPGLGRSEVVVICPDWLYNVLINQLLPSGKLT